jgi:hypothetical protein
MRLPQILRGAKEDRILLPVQDCLPVLIETGLLARAGCPHHDIETQEVA